MTEQPIESAPDEVEEETTTEPVKLPPADTDGPSYDEVPEPDEDDA
jgi:hypothetical protein